MVSQIETGVHPATPLVARMEYHLRSATPDHTEGTHLYPFYKRVEKFLGLISTVDVHSFLDHELNRWGEMSRHLGPDDVGRHGFTWSMLVKDHQPLLVRLYTPSGLPKLTTDILMKRLFKDESRFAFSSIIKRHNMRRYLESTPSESTHSFAAAEILVRTMVASIPRGNFPTALVDRKGEPIGFYLRTPTFVTESKDMEITATDVFFERGFLGGMFDTYGPKNLPDSTQRQYYELKKHGIGPYAEYGYESDLKNMLLYYIDGRPAGFNHLGYFIPKSRKI